MLALKTTHYAIHDFVISHIFWRNVPVVRLVDFFKMADPLFDFKT